MGSEITNELPWDGTPITMIDDKTFQFNKKVAHEPTYKKIIRNWNDNITSTEDYNKSMIQNPNIPENYNIFQPENILVGF